MTYDPEWTLDVLARIRTYHGAQDTGRAAEMAWTDALAHGGVTSGADAVQAVVRHYSQANCNPWITPGDVIGGVRAIRRGRLDTAGFDTITPNVDPADPVAYRAELLAIRAAIADGCLDVEAYRAGEIALTGPGLGRALEGRKLLELEAGVDGVFRRPPRPSREDYADGPVKTRAEIDRDAAAALEIERRRQMAAMELAMHPEVRDAS